MSGLIHLVRRINGHGAGVKRLEDDETGRAGDDDDDDDDVAL